MSILKGLFRREKVDSHQDERIVWGILVSARLHLAYKMIAISLRVPISVLVRNILERWLGERGLTLLEDKAKKQEYADYLVDKYLKKKDLRHTD
jgi:hypothetical protein